MSNDALPVTCVQGFLAIAVAATCRAVSRKDQPIHRAVVLAECPAFGKTIFEHAPDCRATEEYSRLVDIVLKA